MGFAKAQMMEVEERGWEAPDKAVCDRCLEDPYLKQVASSHATETQCDYCSRRSKKAIAAPVSEILVPIASTLHTYFEDPGAAGVPRDTGEWVDEDNIVDTREALESIGLECKEDLFDDVANSFIYSAWYPCADGFWLGQHENEHLRSAWHNFEGEIKHKRRYFFSIPEDSDIYSSEKYDSYALLVKIGTLVSDIGLVRPFRPPLTLFRTRRIKAENKYEDFESVGPPSDEQAIAGRMNPPGIAYFYLSLDQKTALVETLDKAPFEAVVASFDLKREISILDLTKLPELPSIFNPDKRDEREGLLFLDHFVKAIASLVEKDGREHIDYLPSQVVSEYFSQVFLLNEETKLDGLSYPSAVRDGGVNLVIFPRPVEEDRWKQLFGLRNIEIHKFKAREDFYSPPKPKLDFG